MLRILIVRGSTTVRYRMNIADGRGSLQTSRVWWSVHFGFNSGINSAILWTLGKVDLGEWWSHGQQLTCGQLAVLSYKGL